MRWVLPRDPILKSVEWKIIPQRNGGVTVEHVYTMESSPMRHPFHWRVNKRVISFERDEEGEAGVGKKPGCGEIGSKVQLPRKPAVFVESKFLCHMEHPALGRMIPFHVWYNGYVSGTEEESIQIEDFPASVRVVSDPMGGNWSASNKASDKELAKSCMNL